jgi:hypothetical protein
MVISRHVSNCTKAVQRVLPAEGGVYGGDRRVYGDLGTARCEIWLVLWNFMKISQFINIRI